MRRSVGGSVSNIALLKLKAAVILPNINQASKIVVLLMTLVLKELHTTCALHYDVRQLVTLYLRTMQNMNCILT
jgi:hypothetical protein